MARPSLFTDDNRAAAIKMAEQGCHNFTICDALGISRTTFQRWLEWGHPNFDPASWNTEMRKHNLPKDLEPYRTFRNEFYVARSKPTRIAEASWLKAVMEGDYKAAKEWLRTHRREETEPDEIIVRHTTSGDLFDKIKHYAEAFKEHEAEDDDAS